VGAPDSRYQLGHEAAEFERLYLQGRVLGPATRTLLAVAGVRPGMRVLDLGSGVGDVAFVAADLVGPEGEVLGVERSPEAVARANDRARQAGISNVRFTQADIHDPAPDGPFDALIGRLVLMYVADPAAVLKSQLAVLRPGAVIAPIEFDVSTGRSVPPTSLVDQVYAWIAEAFRRAGIRPALGPHLWSVLVATGLRPLGMLGVQPHFGPEDPDGPALLAGIVRTAMPLIERGGVATAKDVGVDTLQQRITAELAAHGAVLAHPTMFSAWAAIE
jgi:ubiquinone/menaquinone biosynthesis C-methylase UbiE